MWFISRHCMLVSTLLPMSIHVLEQMELALQLNFML